MEYIKIPNIFERETCGKNKLIEGKYSTPDEQTFSKKEVILFGEGYGEKIQKGGGLYGPVKFRLFDDYIDGFCIVKIKCRDF